MKLDNKEKNILLDSARKSIIYGLETGQLLKLDTKDIPPVLMLKAATFVTLYLDHELKGCMGNLEAVQPLVLDVIHNAFMAAFRDIRFIPVNVKDMSNLRIEISILTKPRILEVKKESHLVEFIGRHQCGLILKYKNQRATFLPSVWSKIKNPVEFLRNLKLKAGLDPDFWSDDLEFQTYQSEKLT